MYTYVHLYTMYICTCVQLYIYMWVGHVAAKGWHGHLYYSPRLLRQSFSSILKSWLARVLTNELWTSLSVPPGLQMWITKSACYVGSGDTNSAPHACSVFSKAHYGQLAISSTTQSGMILTCVPGTSTASDSAIYFLPHLWVIFPFAFCDCVIAVAVGNKYSCSGRIYGSPPTKNNFAINLEPCTGVDFFFKKHLCFARHPSKFLIKWFTQVDPQRHIFWLGS